MKIRFEKDVLIGAVTPALSAVSGKNTLSNMEGILFTTDGSNRCILSSYDTTKGFRTAVECQVNEQGSYIIGADKLSRFIRMVPGAFITIEVGERNNARITSGEYKIEFSVLPGGEFPNLPELTGEKGFTLPAKLLKETVNQVYHAISGSDARQVMTGAYFRISGDRMRVVACDGFRLAFRERQCAIEAKGLESEDSAISFIVPGKTLAELMKLLPGDDEAPVSLVFGRKHIIFNMGNSLFFSRLIDGEYIAYDRVIPKNNNIRVILPRERLIECLEIARIVTDDRTLGQPRSYVKCSFEGQKLKITAVNSQTAATADVEIEKEGPDLVIGFDCHYLLDALRATGDDEVLMTLSTPLMSITIEPSGRESDDDDGDGEDKGTYLYMIGPVKMKE